MLSLKLDAILLAHATIQTEMQPLLESLKDTTIPLDERWDAYTKLVDKHIFVREQSYGDGFLSGVFGYSNVSLYDDFNMDRHETRTFPELWRKIIIDEDMTAYADPAKRDQWREYVLASGYSGFEHDW